VLVLRGSTGKEGEARKNVRKKGREKGFPPANRSILWAGFGHPLLRPADPHPTARRTHVHVAHEAVLVCKTGKQRKKGVRKGKEERTGWHPEGRRAGTGTARVLPDPFKAHLGTLGRARIRAQRRCGPGRGEIPDQPAKEGAKARGTGGQATPGGEGAEAAASERCQRNPAS